MTVVATHQGYRLNEYEVTREYGGPEEGGWWYTRYSPTGRSQILSPLCTEREAFEVREQVMLDVELDNRENNPRGIFSMAGSYDLTWLVETHEPRMQPATRPHYE